jgi:ribosomal protein S18 acetylase RimI-like enzyme
VTAARRLVDLRPDDVLVRWRVARQDPVALRAEGSSVAWYDPDYGNDEAWVIGLGDDPSTVAALVVELAGEHRVDGVTVVEGAFDLLPDQLRSPSPGYWCHWALDPQDIGPASTEALDLDLDDPRIGPLLAHSDSAYILPGNERLVRWVGVVREGRLVSVAGQVTEESGAAHVVSVCTDPEFRGRGLARDACARIIQSAVADGAPMIVLEMYSDNEAGRRAYSALGFRETGRYVSGLIGPALARLHQR